MDGRAVVMQSGGELLATLDSLHARRAALEAEWLEAIAQLDRIGHAQEIGAHDTARLLSTRYRLDPPAVRRELKVALALPKYAKVSAALPLPENPSEEGFLLHPAQAAVIVSALEGVPGTANCPVEDLVEAEQRMVEAARHLAPADLRKLGGQIRNILDTDGPEPREDAARKREDVWVKKAECGVRFGGYLAAENAELLTIVLQAGAKPRKTKDGELDSRSRGKRQADALVDALHIAAASGDLPARGGIKPHLTITIDLNDLLEAGKTTTGRQTFGDNLSAAAVRRLACDAGIIPIVLGSDSQPLDVGREHRFVTTALRNALNQRDRGCVICGAPPIYCDAHHLVSWMGGGDTSLANLVLLCRVHHGDLHQGHWTIQIIDDQVQVTRPAWTSPDHRKPTPPITSTPTIPAPAAAGSCSPKVAGPPVAAGVPPTVATNPAPAAAASCSPPTVATNPAPATITPWPVPPAGRALQSVSARDLPHTGDVGWITPEEIAALDPWPDTA